jgi:MFS family permease
MRSSRFMFLNAGHAIDHLFLLLFPAVAAFADKDFDSSYADLLLLSTGSFIAFGVCSLPAGWLADRWSRSSMMGIFFVGIGGASILTGMAQNYWQIAAALVLIGVFGAIYHPVGIAMVAQGDGAIGKRLGINGVWGNMGVAISAPIVGLMVDMAGWRVAFFVPGVLSILIGIAWFRMSRGEIASEKAAPKKKTSMGEVANWKRALIAVGLSTAFGGFIFQLTTVSLPEVLDLRIQAVATSATNIGLWAMAIYMIAAFSQVVVGALIDKYSVKPIFLAIAVAQAVTLYLAATSEGWTMIILAVFMMVVVFGQIPINDTLVARFTPSEWRSRMFAVKYVLTFAVAATVVPTIAGVHEMGDGFAQLFGMATIAALVTTAAVSFLPGGADNRAPAAAAGDD